MDELAKSDGGSTVGATGSVDELKPIHIIVMVLTLLHAIAIAVWSLVFLSDSKSTFSWQRNCHFSGKYPSLPNFPVLPYFHV